MVHLGHLIFHTSWPNSRRDWRRRRSKRLRRQVRSKSSL